MMREAVVGFERGIKGKKYGAVIRTHDGHTRRIYFGARGFQQFQDSTGMGLYSHMDHGDPKRRAAYFSRHSGGETTKRAALSREMALSGGIYNAKILSHQYLW